MPLDPTIRQAIIDAIEERGSYTFRDTLTNKLMAWLTSVSSGNENIADKDEAYRHLDAIFEAIDIKEIHRNGE